MESSSSSNTHIMTTYILVAPVGSVDRRDLERIENQVFDNIEDVRNKIEGVELYTLTDFMDHVNDEILEDLSDKWIGHVHVK
jgi:hypothetical protein